MDLMRLPGSAGLSLLLVLTCAKQPATKSPATATATTSATESVVADLDASVDPNGADPSLEEVRGHEREEHARRLQAFEARAAIEREQASKATEAGVKEKLQQEAERLSSMAQRERESLGPPD